MSQQQGSENFNNTHNNTSNDITDLLSKLCTSVYGNEGQRHPQMIMHAAQYVMQSPNAIGSTLPLSEKDCLQKIVNKLNAQSNDSIEEQQGDLFKKFYDKLTQAPIEESRRHKLLHFLLCTMNSASIDSNSRETNGHQQDNNGLQMQLAKMAIKSNSVNNNDTNNNNSNGVQAVRGALLNGEEPEKLSFIYKPVRDVFSLKPHQLPDYLEKNNINSVNDVVQSAIYSFMGTQGLYLKKDVITGRFKLDPLNIKSLSFAEAGTLLRLSELGYYYDRVSKFANTSTGFNAMGCMGQAFITVLKEEITSFLREVVLLQDRLFQGQRTQMRDYVDREKSWLTRSNKNLTLTDLLAWYLKPLHRLQWLTKIGNACQMKKGGQLASVVYEYLDHGNPIVNQMAHDLLTAICRPLVRMISKWMLDGGIDDTYAEFFIESMDEVGADRLWHDKFRLRMSMLPKFVPLELADKILKTGKSVNFLRQVCEIRDLVQGYERLKHTIENNPSQIFAYAEDTSLHGAIETSYQQTSKHVLDVMVGPHKLLDHLHGMRRYLLLGQGDFVSILIENMKDELEKMGNELYAHDLSVMLDAALRYTNAQYDDPEILNHLDVAVQTAYSGDCGWDVISLQYTVQGPLATMLEPSMPVYKSLFKPLWRMKHMEFVLSTKIWMEQMANSKALRSMSAEIGKASYRLHLFTSEIMHFVHQVQYYVLFEVIECNWVELQKHVQQAKELDEILEAHSKFLSTISVGCFVNTGQQMGDSLEAVYDNIITLENWQSNFYEACFKELKARQQYQKRIADSESTGSYGVTTEQKMERDQEHKMFEQKLITCCCTLETIAKSYGKAVRSFLYALNISNDPNLQLFGTRLDFNEYYKKQDTSLSAPLTFEHMRLSNVFGSNHKAGSSSSLLTQKSQYEE